MDSEFLQILVCPLCKGKLDYRREERRFICHADRLVFPITEDGIPILLVEGAEPLGKDTAPSSTQE